MPNWSEVLVEIRELQASHTRDASSAADTVRRKFLAQLHDHVGRNVIAYYSGWLSKPGIAQTEITDEDMNGFMMAIHRMDRTLGLDLILHTPGGDMAATQAIIDYLHKGVGDPDRVNLAGAGEAPLGPQGPEPTEKIIGRNRSRSGGWGSNPRQPAWKLSIPKRCGTLRDGASETRPVIVWKTTCTLVTNLAQEGRSPAEVLLFQ